MQLDGDTMVFVAPDLFQRYPTTESRDRLLREHDANLGAAMPGMVDPTAALRTVGWGATGMLQAAFGLAGLLGGGWPWPVIAGHLAGFTPIALRWAGRPLLLQSARWIARRELRRRTRGFIERYRSEGIAALKPARPT